MWMEGRASYRTALRGRQEGGVGMDSIDGGAVDVIDR